MGLCLSKCGNAHQKAAVVAATISHQTSSENATDLHDSNHSLKKFFQLYDNADAKKSLSSPRPSLGEYIVIPHSSELFSLPDSDAEPSSCRSLSPARTSKGSIARSSISSKATSSPKSRSSTGIRGGTASTDETSLNSRKRPRPPRNSFSSAADRDLAAHKRLVEAIARLERLNDGKHMQMRGSSFCSSDLERKTRIPPTSRSGELDCHGVLASKNRYARHRQQLGQHLARAWPEHYLSRPPAYNHTHTDAHCSSRYEITNHDVGTKKLRGSQISGRMMPSTAFSPPKAMGNLVSLAGPVIKQMPLERSVTHFLREVENFVSLIEAPRLSCDTMQEGKDGPHEPVIITTVLKDVTEGRDASQFASFKNEDEDSQFTFFEAIFEGSDSRLKEKTASADGSQPSDEHFQQLVSNQRNKKCCRAEVAVSSPASEAIEETKQTATTSRNPQKVLSPVAQYNIENSKEFLKCPKNIIIISPSKPKRKIIGAARAVLTEIDPNIMPTVHNLLAAKKSPQKPSLKESRRGVSRSLDSSESSIAEIAFEALKGDPAQQASKRLCNTQGSTSIASKIDARSRDQEDLKICITEFPNDRFEPAYCEDKYTNAGECVAVGVDTSELILSQKLLVQDQPHTANAVSNLLSLKSLEEDLGHYDLNVVSCDVGLLADNDRVTEDALASTLCASSSTNNPPPLERVYAQVNDDSKMFLSKALGSLLKLLQVSDSEDVSAC